MKSIRYIMYFVLMSMTMSLLAQENAQAVAQGENKIDEKVERNTIRKGNGLFNDKKYTEAEIEYRKALEANPSSEIATYNLGAALYKQQKWNDSRNEYRKIVQASSDSLRAAHAWHNLGNISFQEKNYAQSIEEYKNALRRNPKDDETRYNLRLAQLLLKKQQQEQQNQDKNDDKDQQDKNKDQQKDQKQDQQEQNNNQPKHKNKPKAGGFNRRPGFILPQGLLLLLNLLGRQLQAMGLQFLSGMVIAFCSLFRFFGLSRQLWVLQLLFGELEPRRVALIRQSASPPY